MSENSPVYWPFINYYYQRKARDYADDILRPLPEEYNKQITANAYRYLISRSIWGLIFLSGFVFNLRRVAAQDLNRLSFIGLLLGVGFLAWGIMGFRWEMGKRKMLG